jgi:hypothetical protein
MVQIVSNCRCCICSWLWFQILDQAPLTLFLEGNQNCLAPVRRLCLLEDLADVIPLGVKYCFPYLEALKRTVGGRRRRVECRISRLLCLSLQGDECCMMAASTTKPRPILQPRHLSTELHLRSLVAIAAETLRVFRTSHARVPVSECTVDCERCGERDQTRDNTTASSEKLDEFGREEHAGAGIPSS